MTSGSAGIVFLVGAGPGDPELITVRGLKCLQQADVVIYDRLVNKALLEEVPDGAERIFAGKAPGLHILSQTQINQILVERARSGLRVVRLKGGDPFVFGRGGEEAAACAAAGISWEVIPGITSALGVPARCAIPVTHRGVAGAFAVVTGHCVEGQYETDESSGPNWGALAGIDTLVILMGVERLPSITTSLVLHGRSPATPVAIIERGTQPEERIVTGTLDTIAGIAERENICSPATIVVGEVVSLREMLLSGSGSPVVAEDFRSLRILSTEYTQQ
ncbi:MAG: uroporphyrinogen-III C-methyltransferase [Chloroflexi bacterium]|nr:uroporphyrinogen-III C-methyltransferase [Chloroflexota bacterium]